MHEIIQLPISIFIAVYLHVLKSYGGNEDGLEARVGIFSQKQ